jgi:hypothetical protein
MRQQSHGPGRPRGGANRRRCPGQANQPALAADRRRGQERRTRQRMADRAVRVGQLTGNHPCLRLRPTQLDPVPRCDRHPLEAGTRWEVRDWVRWYRSQENPQRRRGSRAGTSRPAAGSVNERTGKPYLEPSYARASINRRLSSLSSFYEFARSACVWRRTRTSPSRRCRNSCGTRRSPSCTIPPHV